MATNPTHIDRLRIASPCPISWEHMTGDNRVRFCDHCQLNVYNISELSRRETETLISSTEGRLCARLYRRADGTVMTKDCPVGLRALRRRLAKRTAAIFATVMSLSAIVFGQHGSRNGKTECTPQTQITRANANAKTDEKIFSGTVVDPLGAVITGATVKLINDETKETRQTSTNDEGRFDFTPVAAGSYSLTVESAGFKTLQIKNIVIEKDQLTNIQMILEQALESTTVGILMGAPRLIDTIPGTTIFDAETIQRLPHQK